MTAHPSDFIAQTTFINPDEQQFRKAKERKRRPKVVLPDLPDGPCCFRCRNWHPPGSHDDFGVCRLLAVITERVPMGAERGTVISVEQGVREPWIPWDYLPTRGFFGACSLFDRKEARDAA